MLEIRREPGAQVTRHRHVCWTAPPGRRQDVSSRTSVSRTPPSPRVAPRILNLIRRSCPPRTGWRNRPRASDTPDTSSAEAPPRATRTSGEWDTKVTSRGRKAADRASLVKIPERSLRSRAPRAMPSMIFARAASFFPAAVWSFSISQSSWPGCISFSRS